MTRLKALLWEHRDTVYCILGCFILVAVVVYLLSYADPIAIAGRSVSE